ncbi:diguanylate cyclase [Dyella humi]|uniref:diguanylate cyclase n=1 Tax=Dyella humi TaxID=1770547 RepID=A0ABW8IH47_9GAMM
MTRWQNQNRPWSVLAIMVGCAFFLSAHAITLTPNVAVSLEQTENLRTSDHAQFLRLLGMLNQQTSSMSAHERWQLRYLDAWQDSFQGDYGNADPALQDVIKHSADPVLVTKASAVLMDDMRNSRRYEPAFELANQLVANLPKTRDKLARYMVLSYASQLLRSAGQYDLAATYARDMAQALPPGETPCQPWAQLLAALQASHKLTSSSADIQRGLEACQAAKLSLFTEIIELVKGDLYLDENQPAKTVALLSAIAPSIRASGFHLAMLHAREQLARAYWKLGDDDNARKAALAVLAISEPDDVNESLRNAYQVLYLIEKKHGRATAALNYYQQYAEQNAGYLNDVSARTLAYDVAQQHMLAEKLETEKLSKQNNILRLQQTLAAKTIETGRLYIVLLLVLLASVIFWLLRTKRSQLHFQRQARLDGLTGIFNHQHFISEAQRATNLLARRQGDACLVFIDLDYFKQINDTHGHAIGDAVLKHTVSICKQPLRATDLFGRLGGEEFGILLLDCPPGQGAVIADRIRTTIEATPVDIDGHVVTFSASIGLASTLTSGYELKRLCRDADAALYRAKHIGRNRVIAYAEHGDLSNAFNAGNAG